MALIDIEGGDHLAASMFQTKGWNGNNPDSIIAGRVRGSGWQWNPFGGNRTLAKVLPSTYLSMVAGIGFMSTNNVNSSSPFNMQIFNFQDTGGSTTIARVGTNSAGRLQVTNSAGTVIATGTTVLAQNAWYFIEMKLIVGTSGTCEVHLNGVPGEILPTVGNFGTTNIGRFALTFNTSGANPNWDDLYVQDLTGSAPNNDFLGDVVIETLFPNGDGTHQAWTPSAAGSHYTKVNEATPDGDTTYVSDISPGDIDTYTVGSLATLSGTVYGVATNLYARKDDAATRQIAPVIREAGTDHVGTTTPGLTTSYLYYRQLYPLDPAGAAWTIASVNGSEYGVKEVS